MNKILRNDAEMALDDVMEYCKFVLDHYRTVAHITHDPDLGLLFRSLEQSRQQWVEALEAEIRLMGNLPSAPDRDREALDHLLIRIRAALTEDERASLLHESDRVEKVLIKKAQAALAEELSVDVRDLVQKIFEGSAQTRERLSVLGNERLR